MNRMADRLDGMLHLMDRQIVDDEGLAVGKVDDVELTGQPDGALVVTGLLLGPAALVPRLGGRFGRAVRRAWLQLRVVRADRDVPGWIPIGRVRELTSELHLDVAREEVIRPQPDPEDGAFHHRLGDLLGSRVVGPSGDDLGRVIDVRLAPHEDGLVAVGVLVGHGRPGSLLGYERRSDQGPWLVATVVRRLHRNTGAFEMDDVRDIDWDERVLRVEGEPRPLRELS